MNNNQIIEIDKDTGEIVNQWDNVTRIVTKQQEEIIENYKEYMGRLSNNNFIFAIFKECELLLEKEKLDVSDIGRIILLTTYLSYDGFLVDSKNEPMTLRNIRLITRCSSDSTWARFKDNVINGNIIKCVDNIYYINPSMFVKGELNKEVVKGNNYSRLFIHEIRHIFEVTSNRDIKKLGYLFQLLPYVSYEYNMVCFNPMERELKKIKYMTLGEVSKVLGLSENGFSLLAENLSAIKTRDGKSIIGQFKLDKDIRSNKLIINPTIMYRGNMNSKQIEAIKSLFS